jgi:L-fuconolactonase
MPEIPIVDAHVHLWNPHEIPMPWLVDIPLINRPMGVPEFQEQTAGLSLTGMVYVEVGVAPQFALLEAGHVVKLAESEPRLRGIVAAAPVEFGERTRIYLDALRDLGPLVKGVRRNVQDEAEADFCIQPDFVRGVQLLADYGYSFDICIRHHQLPAVTELVRRCPQVQFVLDHLGKPNIREHVLDPWRADLERLASLPNVWCKLSGLLTEADPQRWELADLAPYVAHALAVFGPQRVMFGGDWPVMLQAATYPRWVDGVAQLLADQPAEAQRAIWAENASRCYRLGIPAEADRV